MKTRYIMPRKIGSPSTGCVSAASILSDMVCRHSTLWLRTASWQAPEMKP